MDIAFPPFRLDPRGGRLWQGEREIRLRPKTLAVLRYLAERPGRLVSTAELLRAVWTDVAVSDVMPRLCIRELRAALGDDARSPRFIQTRPGRGYQFVAPVLPLTIPRATASEPSPATGVSRGLPLVGRQADLDRLEAALNRARRDERQAVFVSGEPGIGKTSLIEAFLAGSTVRDLWLAKGECVEQYGAGESYLPILTALERLCRIVGRESALVALRHAAPAWLAQMPSLTEPTEQEALIYRLDRSSRQGMLRELASLLEALAQERVLVMWLEDLHWADRSTLDAIPFLARRSDPARLMLLGTYRPTELTAPDHPLARITHELALHGHGQEMSLARLRDAEVAEYLAARLPGTPVSPGLVRHVHLRTDGNPLFMVTVANDLVARALIVQREGQWIIDDARADRPRDVPDALRLLIEQQALRLGAEDRRLVEVASVAGIEFSAAALAAGLEEDCGEVEARCGHLAARGQFLEPRGAIDWPDGTTAAGYSFLHALHQEVLYDGIPAGRRRQLHARIAERLECAFAGRARDVAAELATHFERARDAHRAVKYHGLAGENALSRVAHAEAITHLSRALEILQDLPDGADRSRLEIGLQLALGPALIVTKGYAAVEVERTYSRALELSRRFNETREMVRALRGLWNVRFVRGQLGAARKLAGELLAHAKRARDTALLASAHAAFGETLFHIGEIRAARAHLDQARTPAPRRGGGARSNQRPRVTSYASWGFWMAGYPDQARLLCSQAVAEAKALGHPHNRAFTLGFASFLHEFCGEVSRVAELADEQSALCREYGIPYWQSWAEMLKGWVRARQGHVTEGVIAMHRGLAAHRETGAVVGVMHFLTLLAELHGLGGQIDEGLQASDEALALALTTGNRYLEPDIYRVRGDLLARLAAKGRALRGDPANLPATAEGCFRQALELARRRSARSLELRAATSLAQLWRERGESARARRLLEPLCEWFAEGGDTADLMAARQLVAALSTARQVLPARVPARSMSPVRRVRQPLRTSRSSSRRASSRDSGASLAPEQAQEQAELLSRPTW
jgi:DNA-binding winged helix-turn-helix (wHTH) protein/predicted ATPase